MKTLLLAMALILTGLELRAQTAPPAAPALPSTRRLPRFGNTNGPTTQPRFPQAEVPAAPAAPAAIPGGAVMPGTPAPTPVTAIPAGNPTQNAAAAGAAIAAAKAKPEETIPAGTINFQGVDLNQVLEVYAKFVGRTLIRGALPDAKIILKAETPLTKSEVIQALQAVLALNNISVVNIGDKFVKVLPSDQANSAGAELDRSTAATNLPNMGSYTTRIVQLKYVKPSIMIPFIQPFAKLANSVTAIDDNGILVMRDYAENVKRMMEMIEQIDVSVPAEYISEIIPIRYAKVDEIASALNSLGGGGGGTMVSIGSSASSSTISGFGSGRSSSMGGMGSMGGGMGGGMGGSYQPNSGSTSPFGNRTGLSGGTANPNGTPSTGTTFAQRLNSIVNRASSPTGGSGSGSSQDIQLFGQTKIIPNESSSTLLIYATRQDMIQITNIIAKLDVPLAQVLIEAIIMDVNLGHKFDFGVSAAQSKKSFNQSGSTVGAGGVNNGQPFLDFLGTAASNSFPGNFTKTLPSDNNISYFANIGKTWDVAVQAAQSDSRANIIQRPRIQTSQAKPAQFFVGETVPYVTSTYSGYSGGYGGSSYSQLSVGVELDVTPFINPDGLVIMQIMQEIDELNGTQPIAGVGDVPKTIKRTLNAEIAVKDGDTVILGGFVKSYKSKSKNGVPFLMDIPLLGNLFTKRSDQKDRTELIVLMRPTVLKTPELAAKNTVQEAQRLPGVSAAAAEDARDERKLVDAQRKLEKAQFKENHQYDGFFNPEPDASTNAPATNAVPPASATPPAATSRQQEKMDGLLDRYMAGKMTGEEYMAEREKTLSPAKKARLDAQLDLYAAGKITSEQYMATRKKILTEEN